MFAFTDSGSASVSSSVKLIAPANKFVNSPTCNLSTHDQIYAGVLANNIVYTSSCDFVFQVEAFVGSKSFGTYTSFTYTVRNECLGFATKTFTNLWDFPKENLYDAIKPLDPMSDTGALYLIS